MSLESLGLSVHELSLAGVAAFVVGFSKTGLPGSGILAVPLMAMAFGGRLSVGTTLPLLILADLFAIGYYRQHADAFHLRRLAIWVMVGVVLGTVALAWLGQQTSARDPLGPLIGGIVLVMLALALLRGSLGDRMVPHSKPGSIATGILAGFTTMTSNAAGPVMSIYLTSANLSKKALMGTTAWFFFAVNLGKLPFLVWLTLDNPSAPLFSAGGLTANAVVSPLVVAGALAGRHALGLFTERGFTFAVQSLAAIAAIKLILG